MDGQVVAFRGPCSHCRSPLHAMRGQTVVCARCGGGNRIGGVALPAPPRPVAFKPEPQAKRSQAPAAPSTRIRPPWSQSALWGTVGAVVGGLAFGVVYATWWNRVAAGGSGGDIPIGLLAVIGGAAAGLGVALPFRSAAYRVLKFRGLGLRVRSLGALFGLGAGLVAYATVLVLAFGFYFDATDALAAVISTGAGATAAGRFARTYTAAPMERPGVTA